MQHVFVLYLCCVSFDWKCFLEMFNNYWIPSAEIRCRNAEIYVQVQNFRIQVLKFRVEMRTYLFITIDVCVLRKLITKQQINCQQLISNRNDRRMIFVLEITMNNYSDQSVHRKHNWWKKTFRKRICVIRYVLNMTCVKQTCQTWISPKHVVENDQETLRDVRWSAFWHFLDDIFHKWFIKRESGRYTS